MNIDLEAKCTATHQWVLVARFKLAVEAGDTARALSKLNGYAYRTIDRRWPDEGVVTTTFEAGEPVEHLGSKMSFAMKRDADGCSYMVRVN